MTVVDEYENSQGVMALLQRKLPEQDIAQGSYIALPLTLLLLLAGYNHDKVGKLRPRGKAGVKRQTMGECLCHRSCRRLRLEGPGSCPRLPTSLLTLVTSFLIVREVLSGESYSLCMNPPHQPSAGTGVPTSRGLCVQGRRGTHGLSPVPAYSFAAAADDSSSGSQSPWPGSL